MRSLLMVPAHRRKCLEKAMTLNADSLVFDLEDSVPNGQKENALAILVDFLKYIKPPVPSYVRVNPENLRKEWDSIKPYVDGIMIPKVRTIVDVHQRPYVPTIIVVETPMAILHLEDFFSIDSIVGGVFGIGDYAAGMGMVDRDWVGSVNRRFMYAKQRLATVARAFGKWAIDTSFFIKGLEAEDNTRLQWKEVASWGFTGASPIHPSHIAIANDVFQPSQRELKWSREVINGTEKKNGEVWVDEDGFVVGPPHVKQGEGRIKWQQQAQ